MADVRVSSNQCIHPCIHSHIHPFFHSSIRSFIHQVAVLGSVGVGKSSFTMRFVQRIFVDICDPPPERNFRKEASVDGQRVIVDILDTDVVEDPWMQEGHGFLLLYDITHRESFAVIPELYESLRRVSGMEAPVVVLVGTKSDLSDRRVVDFAEGGDLARKHMWAFFETSAKLDDNVEACFQEVIRTARRRQQSGAESGSGSKLQCTIL